VTWNTTNEETSLYVLNTAAAEFADCHDRKAGLEKVHLVTMFGACRNSAHWAVEIRMRFDLMR